MLILPGSNALPAFRSQRLLAQLQAIDSNVVEVSGRFDHFIDVSTPLSQDDIGRLTALPTAIRSAPVKAVKNSL